jgi:hypothetical protein
MKTVIFLIAGRLTGNVPGNVEKLARRSGVARLEPVGSGC